MINQSLHRSSALHSNCYSKRQRSYINKSHQRMNVLTSPETQPAQHYHTGLENVSISMHRARMKRFRDCWDLSSTFTSSETAWAPTPTTRAIFIYSHKKKKKGTIITPKQTVCNALPWAKFWQLISKVPLHQTLTWHMFAVIISIGQRVSFHSTRGCIGSPKRLLLLLIHLLLLSVAQSAARAPPSASNCQSPWLRLSPEASETAANQRLANVMSAALSQSERAAALAARHWLNWALH